MTPTLLTRIKFVEADPKFTEAWEQFRLYRAVNRIVDALVHSGQHITISLAYTYDLGDLPPRLIHLSSYLHRKCR